MFRRKYKLIFTQSHKAGKEAGLSLLLCSSAPLRETPIYIILSQIFAGNQYNSCNLSPK